MLRYAARAASVRAMRMPPGGERSAQKRKQASGGALRA